MGDSVTRDVQGKQVTCDIPGAGKRGYRGAGGRPHLPSVWTGAPGVPVFPQHQTYGTWETTGSLRYF